MRRYFGENAGKIALIVLSILFLLLLFFYSLYGVSAFSGDGEGTSENPFQVTNCEQLQEMRDNLFASYILMNDIDCSDTINWNGGNGFEPIGSNFVTTFSGEFNGNNHKIQRPANSFPKNTIFEHTKRLAKKAAF